MGAREQIEAEIDRVQEELITPLLESFPWEQKEAYVVWLCQTYHYVLHTLPLLNRAIKACGP